jgi:putative endonuclease
MDSRPVLGRNGEDVAAAFYEARGFDVLERNYRVGEGEIDVIARRDDLIVFCEVKTRRSDAWGSPSEAVAWSKQQRLRRLAAKWMRERKPGAVGIRFDVISIVLRQGGSEVTHLPSAF